MWLTFGVIACAMLLYVTEYVPIEITSLLALVTMLLLFTLFPQIGPNGTNLLDATALLAGFGNPALITVMALLVMAQGLFQSGALKPHRPCHSPRDTCADTRHLGHVDRRHAGKRPTQQHAGGIDGDTIIVAIAKRAKLNPARHMMSLSFMTILGGMLTLIGSSAIFWWQMRRRASPTIRWAFSSKRQLRSF